MSARLTVAQLVEALGVSYQTIDIRLGAMREKDVWINGIATIRLSRRSVDEVRKHHESLLQRYNPVRTEHFRLELLALPFSEWPQFLKACSEGVLHIGDEVIKWAEPPKIEEQQGYIQRYQGDLRDQERWRWPSFSQWCGGRRPQGLQSDTLVREVAASGWSTPHQAINSLCEMNITFGSPYEQEIFLSIPVYVFIENMTVSTVDNSVHATYLRHSAIPGLNLVSLLKERDRNSIEVVLRRVPLAVEPRGTEEDIGIFSCRGEIDTANREHIRSE